jgi:hypothetical protein
MPKRRLPEKIQMWIDARKKHHLSHVQIQMARELGLNPKDFGKMANVRLEPWKAPLPKFIEELYFKRFHRYQPQRVIPIEDVAKAFERQKEERRIERQRIRELEAQSETETKSILVKEVETKPPMDNAVKPKGASVRRTIGNNPRRK